MEVACGAAVCHMLGSDVSSVWTSSEPVGLSLEHWSLKTLTSGKFARRAYGDVARSENFAEKRHVKWVKEHKSVLVDASLIDFVAYLEEARM